MTMFSAGFVPTKTIILNDALGLDKVRVLNSHGFEVYTINSKGKSIQKGPSVKK